MTKPKTSGASAGSRPAPGRDWRAGAFWLRTRGGWCDASEPSVVRYEGAKAHAEHASQTAAQGSEWADLLAEGGHITRQ